MAVSQHDTANGISSLQDETQKEQKTQPDDDKNSEHSKVGLYKTDADVLNEDSWKYGWICCKPKCFQYINNPKGYLFFLCLFVFAQGFTVNGIVYVVLSTLERRFNLPSVQSGLIASTYDLAALSVVGFITYFGENGHKPFILGAGALIFSLGSATFTLPHFLSPPYSFESMQFGLCDFNQTNPDICDLSDETNLSRYYWIFIAAQVLHGFGAAPIFTLGLTYIDENLPPKSAAFYTGVFQTTAVFGPAIGFLAGGVFLDLYTDFYLNTDHVDISPDNPLWIGAWWLGFLVSASLAILVVVPMLGFPKHLPAYHKAQLKRHNESRIGSKVNLKAMEGVRKLTNITTSVWTLVKNPTYTLIVLAQICETFAMAYVSSFGPKYIESMFTVSAGTAALLIGVMVIPAGLIGSLAGGWIIKHFDLTIPAILKSILCSITIGFLVITLLLFHCPDPPFAGVTVGYDISSPVDGNLTSWCNIDCDCVDVYNPVCGSDNIIYFSSCHAGCSIEQEIPVGSNNKMYGNCSCVGNVTDVGGTAVPGLCRENCTSIYSSLGALFLAMLTTSFIFVPSITCVLRCVDYSQRSFALGIQVLMTKALGYVPGPIIFGALLDKTCLLWEHECHSYDTENCWMYDNQKLAYIIYGMTAVLRLLSICFYTGALCTYKPAKIETGERTSLLKNDDSVSIAQSSSKYETI